MNIYQKNVSPFINDIVKALQGFKAFQSHVLLMKVYMIMIVLFAIAILPMPYEFYISLRMLICIGLAMFIYALSRSEAEGLEHYKYMLLGLIVLYNPLFVIHLGSKLIWAIVNTGTLYLLFTIRRKIPKKHYQLIYFLYREK